MACKCLYLVDKELAKRNTRIVFLMHIPSMKPTTPMIATEQVERGRGKPKAAILGCSYCPFCGKEFDPPEERR